MYYGDRTLEEMDTYYGINVDTYSEYPRWLKKDCEKIQKVMADRGIYLTLAECRLIYNVYSDECFCSGWNSFIDNCKDDDLFEIILDWLKDIIMDRSGRIIDIVVNMDNAGYGDPFEDVVNTIKSNRRNDE